MLLTTELDAVNIMLMTIGEPGVSVLDDTVAIANQAQKILRFVSEEVQNLGLKCNTYYDITFTPDVNGLINVPENTLMVESHDGTIDISLAGEYLYDHENNTQIFTKNIRVNYILGKDFLLLTSPVRQYITIRASRLLHDQTVGDQKVHFFTKEEEAKTYKTMCEKELRTKHNNIFNNYAASRAVIRRQNIRHGG